MEVGISQQRQDISNYFLPAHYRINDNPDPCIRSKKKKPDAQWNAYNLAQKLKGERILDVGCGDGTIFMNFFSGKATLGLDIEYNIDICKKLHPDNSWSVIDLDSPFLLPDTYDLIICADVIEHLKNPEYLLAELARLNRAVKATIVISTPERDLKRGTSHLGPPPNSMHVREWNRSELLKLLVYFGLDPQFELLPTSRNSKKTTTLAAICRPSPAP
ncbi:MAG: methyltransferase domain-containing protein [Patescibacteria group bacterium]|nr:methyltransferase domain-containing protein [Patescibacteria group bacterium]